MLVDLYPRFHRRYSSLPIVGPALDGFAVWLFDEGYPRPRVRQHVRTARRLDRELRSQGTRDLNAITRGRLLACAPADSQDDADLAATVRLWERYLGSRGLLGLPEPPSRVAVKVAAYATFLERVRGFAPSTILQHRATVAAFLAHLRYETQPSQIVGITGGEIEEFVRATGKRISRPSLQHTIAQLRGFLRFLVSRGEIPPGLDKQIDTPRVYRLEKLPRALPWTTVQTFLRSIDRSTPLGLRDYAIFLLIATYGLRASEIVALTLDDIEWRAGRIRVPRRKTGTPLLLPLTDTVSEILVDYLRRGRAALACRELFLRARAPAGVLKPTAVTEAFQAWSRRSGLKIPFQGAHCLRHSYAVRLLRQGTPLKTIGDLLGHRNAESTCVYLRLAVEDLRGVALPLPRTDLPEMRP